MTLYIPGAHGMEYDEDAARTYAHAQMFLGELKAIDSRLELVWAKPNAESLDGGFWYIVRHNEHADTYWQINDGAGEYSDPEWRHLERFKAANRRAPRHLPQLPGARDARIAQGEQSRAELHREFREKLDARLKHLYEVQIHVPVDVVAEPQPETSPQPEPEHPRSPRHRSRPRSPMGTELSVLRQRLAERGYHYLLGNGVADDFVNSAIDDICADETGRSWRRSWGR